MTGGCKALPRLNFRESIEVRLSIRTSAAIAEVPAESLILPWRVCQLSDERSRD